MKKADVSGSFYPASPQILTKTVSEFIENAKEFVEIPKAIIAPHAGYIYSGPVAGTAYRSLKKISDKIKNVILLSPSHRIAFEGVAFHSDDKFETPLGVLDVNMELIEKLKTNPLVKNLDIAFSGEHALEVHLPFIQTVFDNIQIVPLIVGQSPPEELANMLEKIWSDQNIIIVSSDLSHFLPYSQAYQVDQQTQMAIEKLDYSKISTDGMCGYYPVSGLLALARNKNLIVKTIDLRNSGDTAGDKDSVVGYGAFLFY